MNRTFRHVVGYAFAGILGVASAAVCAASAEPSYQLVTTVNGHDYVDDFDMTADDCRAALDRIERMSVKVPGFDGARCERQH